MVFASLEFLYFFLPVVLVIYFITPIKFRNIILLIISLFFYSWGEPVYVILLLFSILVDYTVGRGIDRHRGNKKAKYYLLVSMFLNLGLLGFFKYADFLLINLNSILNVSIRPLNLPLPIGISFFTFQTMSYSIDLYRGKVKVQKNIISFATYVCLFPQLIAGPIVRYATVEHELNHRKISTDDVIYGLERFMIGLGKKVLIANQMGYIWSEVKSLDNPGTIASWLGIIAFAFQIFYDFSGYSDMAIGLGRIFGFHFLENFNQPYLSKSITEFWRRWHISLGTWFREYVYIPLGGNRVGKYRHLVNILVVWMLTGFWHGASWNFLLWGLYFGLFLLLEKFYLNHKKTSNILMRFYTIFVVLIGWVFFEFESLTSIVRFLSGLFSYNSSDRLIMLIIGEYTPFYLIAILAVFEPMKKLTGLKKSLFSLSVLILSTLYLINQGFNPFIYFRF
jgi:alginate O-acetyltransferase complex protein AlgI